VSRSKFVRTASGVPALVVIALTVAACSPVHPGAAATVGNTRVSVSALNTAVAQAVITPDTSTGQVPDRPTAVLSSLTAILRDDLIADAAKSKGVTVAESDVQSFLAQQRQNTGSDAATASQAGIPLAGLHAAAYENVLLDKLVAVLAPGVTDTTAQNTALTSYLATIVKQEGISVNPRYGVWDPADFDVVASNAFTSPASSPPAAPAG
jgi:hypothetical protein